MSDQLLYQCGCRGNRVPGMPAPDTCAKHHPSPLVGSRDTLGQKKIAAYILSTLIEVGERGMPSSYVYIALTEVGVELDTYNATLAILVKAGLVTSTAHLLRATEVAQTLFRDSDILRADGGGN